MASRNVAVCHRHDVRLESVMRFKAEVGESNTGLFRLPLKLIHQKFLVSRSVPARLAVLACFDPQS
jgi:hypothetical protein